MGYANCLATAPDLFDLDDDGIAIVIGFLPDSPGSEELAGAPRGRARRMRSRSSKASRHNARTQDGAEALDGGPALRE